jgi:Ca2+/Na+ antiporter
MPAVLLFLLGIGLILWAAERLTDGILGTAASIPVGPFFIGALVSGLEPENSVRGVVANFQGLPQVAFLVACVLLVGALLMTTARLDRRVGAALILLYLFYLAVNLSYL